MNIIQLLWNTYYGSSPVGHLLWMGSVVHVLWTIYGNSHHADLPWTVSVVLTLADPAALAARHVYWPVSSGWANAICRVPERRTRRRIDSGISWPSLCHEMLGGGRPSASQGRETGLSTAVMYSARGELMTGGTARHKILIVLLEQARFL